MLASTASPQSLSIMTTRETAVRQTRRFEQKREAILDAAARLFNQKGLKGATLADVAGSVGLITTSVTYYYKKKEDLAAACLLRTTGVLADLIAAAARGDTVADRVRSLLGGYFGLLADIAEGRRVELINFYDIRALSGQHVRDVSDAFNNLFRSIRSLLRDPAAPSLDRTAENARAHLFFSQMLWARAWVRRYEPSDYARAAERMGDILLAGVAAPTSKWRPIDLVEPEPGGEETEITREAFLRAVTELLNDQGYHGASVDKISARLNVTKGSFYHHNATKDDLVVACFAQSFETIRRTQKAAQAQGRDGWEKVTSAADALVRRQMTRHGPLLRYTALAAAPETMREGLLSEMNRLSERFSGQIADGIADGSIRPVDPVICAQMVIGMINAAAELRRWAPGADASGAGVVFARPLFLGMAATQP